METESETNFSQSLEVPYLLQIAYHVGTALNVQMRNSNAIAFPKSWISGVLDFNALRMTFFGKYEISHEICIMVCTVIALPFMPYIFASVYKKNEYVVKKILIRKKHFAFKVYICISPFSLGSRLFSTLDIILLKYRITNKVKNFRTAFFCSSRIKSYLNKKLSER